MSGINLGMLDLGGVRDKEGHREFDVTWLVQTTNILDGPAVVMHSTAGLPVIGSTYFFGNDIDVWAFCYPNLDVARHPDLPRGEKGYYWTVTQKFSTKPLSRCQDSNIENPLAEPMNLSGGFNKYTYEATRDRFGNFLKSSSHEQFRGSNVERDGNRPTVSIQKNLITLPLSTFAPMVDTVNSSALWGLNKRMIKLSNVSWARKLYGTCTFYYTVTYEFDIRYDTFDPVILDEGSKVLAVGGDKNNPNHFIIWKDINGENARILLDGNGGILLDATNPVSKVAEIYFESNFLSLGIPTSL